MQEKLELDSSCIGGCERKAWTVWRTVRGQKARELVLVVSMTWGLVIVSTMKLIITIIIRLDYYIQWQYILLFSWIPAECSLTSDWCNMIEPAQLGYLGTKFMHRQQGT